MNIHGQPTFLADPNTSQSNDGSSPHGFVELNGEVLFGATDRLGQALWKSDGTEEGTQLVKRNMDMNGGSILNNSLIFVGSDIQNIYGIWKTDGTSEGTELIRKIENIPYFSNKADYKFNSQPLQINDYLYVLINDELWKIDGSFEGSYPIMDSCFGNIACIDSSLYFFTIRGNSLLLNESNGTRENTHIIHQYKRAIFQDVEPLNIIVAHKDTLYFFAENDTSLTLYRSDGTTQGTVPLWGSVDFSPFNFCHDLVFYHDTLYFITLNKKNSSSTIWRYADNHVDTLLQFSDLYYQPSRIIKINDGILAIIRVRNSWGGYSGIDILRITGNGASNSVSLADPGYSDFPMKIESADSVAYFFYRGNIWKTDGSYAVNLTSKLSVNDYNETKFTLGKRFLYFAHREDSIETEPWIGTGNVNENWLIKDINQEFSSSWIRRITPSGNKAYFAARDITNGYEPWVTDGTPAGTFLLKDIYPGTEYSSPHQFIDYEGSMYFIARRGSFWYYYGVDTSCYLWKTDGTTSGTIPVKRAYNSYSVEMEVPLVLNDKFYFSASVYDTYPPYAGVWVSDGSTDGTYLLKAVNEPYFGSNYPTSLTRVGNSIFFAANHAENGVELWKTDGSESGTVKVKTDFPGTTGFENLSTCIGTSKLLFFSSGDPNSGFEPWVSDGTEEGTHILADINPGTESSNPFYIGSLGDRVFLSATEGSDSWPLFVSDGTLNGTSILQTFQKSVGKSIAWNEKIYFPANDGIHGWELWCSDGTSDGTYMIKDIIQGSEGGVGGLFCLYNDLLYFSVDYPDGNSQIWSSDGTSDNTVSLDWNADDIAHISAMTIIDNNLVFSASDSQHGNCLYNYKLNVSLVKNHSASDQGFLVFPNPAKDELWIKITGSDDMSSSRFEIINAKGMVVRSFVLHSGGNFIKISDLSQGIYLIRMRNTNKTLIQRFVKL